MFLISEWTVVKITQSLVKQTAPKETHCRPIGNAIGTWQLVGTVFKELLEIGCQTNVFLCGAAVLDCQVGLMALTRQSPKVW